MIYQKLVHFDYILGLKLLHTQMYKLLQRILLYPRSFFHLDMKK